MKDNNRPTTPNQNPYPMLEMPINEPNHVLGEELTLHSCCSSSEKYCEGCQTCIDQGCKLCQQLV